MTIRRTLAILPAVALLGVACAQVLGLEDRSSDPWLTSSDGYDSPEFGWAGWPMLEQGNFAATEVMVLDRSTSLMWQRSASSGNYTWAEAVIYCSRLMLGGHDDWRLPSRIELVSILDYTGSDPAIDTSAFRDPNDDLANLSKTFWSVSRYIGSAACAWAVDFKVGNVDNFEKSAQFGVRCVRDAPVGQQ